MLEFRSFREGPPEALFREAGSCEKMSNPSSFDTHNG